jgi:hypothetical protein
LFRCFHLSSFSFPGLHEQKCPIFGLETLITIIYKPGAVVNEIKRRNDRCLKE